MNINNECISNWIYERFKADYFKFDRICSAPKIIEFVENENSLIVEYEFWDDGHAESDNQDFFMFDIKIGNDYGFNYPAQLQLIRLKDRFIWGSVEQYKILSPEVIDEEHLSTEINVFEWGDKEIEELVNLYFPDDISSNENVKKMLIEAYKADQIGLPKCIPTRLINYFQSIINYDF
jgi:hypothetical protein